MKKIELYFMIKFNLLSKQKIMICFFIFLRSRLINFIIFHKSVKNFGQILFQTINCIIIK